MVPKVPSCLLLPKKTPSQVTGLEVGRDVLADTKTDSPHLWRGLWLPLNTILYGCESPWGRSQKRGWSQQGIWHNGKMPSTYTTELPNPEPALPLDILWNDTFPDHSSELEGSFWQCPNWHKNFISQRSSAVGGGANVEPTLFWLETGLFPLNHTVAWTLISVFSHDMIMWHES